MMRLSELVLRPLCKPPSYYQKRKSAGIRVQTMRGNTPTLKGNHPESSREKVSASINVRDLFDKDGTAALRTYLLSLSVDELKAIIKKEHFDTARMTRSWKDKKRLSNFILEETHRFVTHGDAFREHPLYLHNPKYALD